MTTFNNKRSCASLRYHAGHQVKPKNWVIYQTLANALSSRLAWVPQSAKMCSPCPGALPYSKSISEFLSNETKNQPHPFLTLFRKYVTSTLDIQFVCLQYRVLAILDIQLVCLHIACWLLQTSHQSASISRVGCNQKPLGRVSQHSPVQPAGQRSEHIWTGNTFSFYLCPIANPKSITYLEHLQLCSVCDPAQ